MSSFQVSNPLFNTVEPRYDDSYRLLGEGQGAGFLPSSISNLVNQNVVSNTTGGAGSWAFGMFNTPSKAILNYVMGWDGDVHLKPDANWKEEDARKIGIPQAMMSGIMYLGGETLLEDIRKNSVSRAHFMQRIHEAEVIASATYSIDKYDQDSNFLTYGSGKTVSALVNYIGADPSTAVSLIVTGGLGNAATAAKVGAGASKFSQGLSFLGRAGGVGTQINNFAATHTKTWKAATYLWNATDGASTGYASWDQLRRDNLRLYGGDSEMSTPSWTTSVLFGAGLGAGFTGSFDLAGALFRARAAGVLAKTGGPSALENIAANSPSGTRNTPADHVALSTYNSAKSRLEVALDATEAPDSALRRVLMDDDLLEDAGWGGARSMDEISDFIERNKPSTTELQEFIGRREQARLTNLAEAAKWNEAANIHVQNGSDPVSFWRSKAHGLLKQHMGDAYAQYRHVIDFFENQGHSPEQVARWMAHADAEGVERAFNGINAAARISAVENKALEAAAAKVKFVGEAAAQDAFEQAGNRLLDHTRQGRWSAAVQVANDLFDEVEERTAGLLTDIQKGREVLNTQYNSLHNKTKELVDSHNEILAALKEYETLIGNHRASSSKAQRSARAALDPEATNADVLSLAGESLTSHARTKSMAAKQMQDKIKGLLEAHNVRLKEQAVLQSDVGLIKDAITRDVGDGALDMSMVEIRTFPLWQSELSDAAFIGARNTSIGQTKAGSLWKTRFVDRFMGSGAADNAMRSGEFPTRPALRAQDPLKPLTSAEQSAVLDVELKAIEPEIARIKEAAANVTMPDKIAAAQLARDGLAESIKKQSDFVAARTHPSQKTANAAILAQIEKKQKLLTRLESNVKRLEDELQGNMAVVDAPIKPDSLVSSASLLAAKHDAQKAANTAAGKKLAELPLDEFATTKGRKIRNEARLAAASLGTDTRFTALSNLDQSLDETVKGVHSNIAALQAAGHTEASDVLKAARAELTYLEKEAVKVKQHISDINGRPSQVRRVHELNSATPKLVHVAALSRLRSALETAVSTGDKAGAARIQSEIYSKFGDATKLPRWPQLEEFFNKQARDIADGKPPEQLLDIKMNGRQVEITVTASTVPDPTPGTSLSIKRYGHEVDVQRSIDATLSGRKPITKLDPEVDHDKALAAGLVYYPTPSTFTGVKGAGDGIYGLPNAASRQAADDYFTTAGTFSTPGGEREAAIGRLFGFTEKEIADFNAGTTHGYKLDPTHLLSPEEYIDHVTRTDVFDATAPGTPASTGLPPAKVAGTPTTATPAKAAKPKDGAAAVAEPSGTDKAQAAILASLAESGTAGERLLITSAILRGLGRVPQLRRLGRLLFAAQGAGTSFGTMHNSARILDSIVTCFNMLDRPEALVKSLGSKLDSVRTLQNFRGQAQLAVAEVADLYNIAARDGHWTAQSNGLINVALDTGVADGLNAGETAVFNAIRRHYQAAGEALNISHGNQAAMPNYRAREANSSLFNHRDAAARDFRDAYRDNIMSGRNPMPDELLDTLGIPRGTTWAALTPAQQADNAILQAVDAYATASGIESIKRISGSITEDGVGYTRHAGLSSSSASARTMDDAVRNDPRIDRWYIESPVDNFKRYMEVRAPGAMFNAQLTEIHGTPTTFNDYIAALKSQTTAMPPAAAKEYEAAIKLLEEKWKYATGRAQYNPDLYLDAFFRIGTGLVRGKAGGHWGLAGVVMEIPRAIAAAGLYGGSVGHGLMDAMHYIRHSNDRGVMSDIAHSVDQYSSFAHSTFGQSVGTTVMERFRAPWERAISVARGAEAITTGGQEYGRTVGTAIAVAEALGETAMRAGGMHYFSGMARVIADRQSKRFISRNINRMVDLADRLHAIGPVAEASTETIARFKLECRAAGIPYDVAIQLNHNGMLTPQGTRNLQAALAGQDEVFNLHDIRGVMNDQAFAPLMDFMQAVHAHAVPVTSLASSVQAKGALEKYFYMLTSYSRSFATGVAFRTAANGSWQTAAAAFAAVAIGENIYQTLRSIAVEKKTPEQLQQEWQDNPTMYFLKNTVKSPYLGAHHSTALSILDGTSGGSLQTHARGGNIFSGALDAYTGVTKLVYGKGPVSSKVWDTFKTHTPIVNTWYSRLMLGGQMDQ